MMKPQLYSVVILLLARINYVQNTKQSTQGAATSSIQLPLYTTTSVVTFTTKAPETKVPNISAPESIPSVTKAPKGNTTSVAKTSHETTDKITVLSEAPNSKATSAPSLAPNVSPVHTTKEFTMTTRSDGIPRATGSISISIGKQTPNPTFAPSLAPNVSSVPTTKEFIMTTRSDGIPKATGSPSISIGKQTPNPTSAPSLAPNVSSVRTTKEFIMTTRSDGIPRATGSPSISIGKQTSNPTLAGNATTQRIDKVTNTVHKTKRPTSTKPTTAKATGNRTSTFPVPSLFAIVLLVVSVLCF